MEASELLVQEIRDVSLDLFEKGYYREAMINSILCLFDMIREESGLQDDGASLIGKAFSVEKPRIILSDLQSDSGRNIQKGVIQILQGYFLAYRNVASHSLEVKLGKKDSLSVLISISRFYEQIKDAKKAIFLRFDGLYCCPDGGGNQYIRFYEDSSVISVTTLGGSADVINWFNKENAEDFKHFSIGTYEVNERTLTFYTQSSSGRVDYKAIIRPDTLHVNSESQINGYKGKNDYNFLTWNCLKGECN